MKADPITIAELEDLRAIADSDAWPTDDEARDIARYELVRLLDEIERLQIDLRQQTSRAEDAEEEAATLAGNIERLTMHWPASPHGILAMTEKGRAILEAIKRRDAECQASE